MGVHRGATPLYVEQHARSSTLNAVKTLGQAERLRRLFGLFGSKAARPLQKPYVLRKRGKSRVGFIREVLPQKPQGALYAVGGDELPVI